MMTRSNSGEGICHLICKSDKWIWDQRTEILSLNSEFIFRLASFGPFEEDLEALLKAGKLTLVEQALVRLSQEPLAFLRSDVERRCLRHALGTLAFLVLCFTLRGQARRWSWRRFRAGELTDLRRTAERVLGWLGADRADTAWRDRYSQVLDYERRFQLVDMGRYALGGVEMSSLSLSEHDLWEARWWSTRCQFELAVEWYQKEGHHNPKARRALLDASGIYLRLLKDEPRRQALEHFLNRIGTDPEREVKRIFSVRSAGQHKCLVSEDEAARRVFIDWFLKRYSLGHARSLVFQAGTKRDLFCAFASIVLGIGAIFVFVAEGAIPLMIALQLGSLILMVVGAPSLFRVMLPRALFGSLIAWLTIVLVQATSVFPLNAVHITTQTSQVARPDEMRELCHRWLAELFKDWGSWGIGLRQAIRPSVLFSPSAWNSHIVFIAILLAVVAVSFAFIVNEVNGRVLKGAWLRSGASLFIMLLGALFWGITFANPIRFLIEGGAHPSGCHCVVAIWLLGSFVSVLFGILLQVLTEERPLAAPLGEEV